MYYFRDINDASDNAVMPSEALKLNGEYIENLIPGYKTLYTKGREALSPDVELVNTGVRDGAQRKYSRYPERYITVGYQLLAASSEEFRNAFNALGGVLDVTDAQLIFNDEPDKYFTGSLHEIGAVNPGRNQIVGEFEFVCTDPFKYSVQEYEVEPTIDDGLAFLVDYKGTYKSFPKLQADFYRESEVSDDGERDTPLTGDGDCGFVAFFNEREKIVQLGDPGEDDGEDLPKSQTLVYQEFIKSGAWGTSAKAKWSANNSVVSDTKAITQTGSFGIAMMNNTDYYLAPANFGSGTKYHGPSIARTIPADAAGDSGAKNFTFSVKHKMAIGSDKNATKQLGAFQVLLVGDNDKIVAGFSIFKGRTGKNANLRLYANGKVKKKVEIDLSCNNKHFGHNTSKITAKKLSTIRKDGSKIFFTIGCLHYHFGIPEISDMKVKEIHITTSKYGNYSPLTYNGIRWVKFVKNKCDTWQEVPNKFSTGDSVTADCSNGEILLNESLAPELGAMGNDYEEFYLQPGANQIGIAYSDWVADANAPTFKLKYREVFL